MSLNISSLSQLGTAVFHLKLLDQVLEQLKDPTYTSPSFQTEPTTKPEVYGSTKTIQIAIDTIKTFEEHIKNISPKAKAIAPKIFKNATSELNKIKNILNKLPSSSNKTDLFRSIDSCTASIATAKEALIGIETKEAQKSLGWGERVGVALANAASSLLNSTAELGRINALIQDYKEKLNDFTASDAPLNFADSVSQFAVSYLEEQVLHVKEREIQLRPPFLEYFFDNLYSTNPQETNLSTLVKNALKDNKPLMKATIELNLLKGLNQAYSTLHNIENKTFLIDLMRNSFHIAIESVRREEEAREQGGINPLTVEERNRLLIGTFQKELVQFILDFAFPKGAEELELPKIFSSDIPFLKNQLIWPLVQKGLETLTQSIFSDLSNDDDVKTQLLIQGYTQANSLLENKAPMPQGPLKGLSKISALSIGIVTAFFNIIFNAFKKAGNQVTPYPQQKAFNDDLYKAMEWAAEGSKLLKIIFNRYGRRLADSAGAAIANSLKNVQSTDFLNQQLASIAEVLSPEGEPPLFPRTKQEEKAIKQNREKTKEQNKETLKTLRTQFSTNIDGLISQITDAIYPPLKEADLSRARILTQRFLRSCLYYFIYFVSWVIRLKPKMKKVEQRLYTTVHRMDQDAVLMAVTRGTTEKISETKKTVPPEG